MAELTPMMQQYMKTKEEYKDCILFYRLGDFYEMFFDDALTASKELEITLTGKNCGLEERAPMCGVPYHAVDSYLNKLVEKGYKVGICEQVEDPSQAKGIVKREIVRIVTPGTNISQQSLDDEKNNYLMCIFANDGSYGISFVDVTTGDFRTTSMDSLAKVRDEIFKFEPAEIICNDAFLISGMDFDYLKDKMSIVISSIEPYHFDEEQAEERIKRQFKVGNLEGLGLLDHPMGVIATGALLGYLHETQKSSLDHLMHIEAYETSEFMIIDSSSRRNLELCETLRDKQKKGSLLWVLDKTKTAMGARMLRNMVEQPLVDKKKIEERYDAITTLTDQTIVREELREYLLDQDIWEREVDELLGNFNDNVTEDDLYIVAIFDSAYDLASNYIDNVIGELDHHIEAVLDYTELGNHIAENGDEYVVLSSGRIVEFEL